VAAAVLGLLLAAAPAGAGPARSARIDELQRRILRGWNTWNNPSVLSHVHMPDGLALSLAFRKKRGGPYWLRDAYIAGPNTSFPEKIVPRDHAFDGSYTELELSWEGLEATVRTAIDGDDIVILFSPRAAPDMPPVLLLEAGFLWNKPGTVWREGAGMVAEAGARRVPIGSTAPAVDVSLPVSTAYLAFPSDREVGFYTGPPRTVEGIRAVLERRHHELEERVAAWGDLAPAYDAMQTLFAWNTIYDAANDRALTPVSRVWNEAWGGYIIFDWDTYFTAWMLALDQKDLAYASALAMTHALTREGFVPNLEASFGVKSFDRSQPPVGSLACRAIYDRHRERWFLEEVYPQLLEWNRWWPRARDNRGYLSWGSDPHPRGMEGNTKQAALWESGLDNSPLFDEAVFDPERHVLDLASAGLMGLYVADCRALADIARILGHEGDALELEGRAERYTRTLQTLWDEETGRFRDKDLRTGEFPTHFYPLIGKVATPAQAERMVREHLLNPDELGGEWMVPSISRDDPAFGDNTYWRGRIWAPMNFLVYLGLRNYDLPQARRELVSKSLALLMKEWDEHRRVHENYNATTGVGGDVRNSDSFYSWGALLGFMSVMEAGQY
jgi:putative isomerase